MVKKKYIWIVCEYNQYDMSEILQLLHKANELKIQTNASIWIICIGQYSKEKFMILEEYGATDVLYEPLEVFDLELYINVLEQMILAYEPDLLIFTDKQDSKLIAATLSNRFDVGLTADCIDILVDNKGEYLFSRTAINNSVIANIKCIQSKFQICTVKKNVFQSSKKKNRKEIEIHRLLNISKFKCGNEFMTIMRRWPQSIEKTVDIFDSKVVFSVGRGIQNRENFELLKKVASYWKAEIVGTRAAVEDGWIDEERQIGQSGISIAPALCISFGVSGAIQHMIGLKNAKTIIAINKDPTSPIHNFADYCIVEDINNILYEMIKYI